MGVDTGRDLHVGIVCDDGSNEPDQRHVIHLGICHDFSELDAYMDRFNVDRCVIDGLPETQAPREFAQNLKPKGTSDTEKLTLQVV